jgi:hypothetical protein
MKISFFFKSPIRKSWIALNMYNNTLSEVPQGITTAAVTRLSNTDTAAQSGRKLYCVPFTALV